MLKEPVAPGRDAQTWLPGDHVVFVVILTACLAGVAVQSATYVNHDVAWVLYSAGRLIDGGVFGDAVVAANPPLIWWVSEIPLIIARSIGADPVAVLRSFVGLVGLGSIWITVHLLGTGHSRTQRVCIGLLLAHVLFLAVHRDYGQREHLCAMVALPYLMTVAARLEGRSVHRGLAFAIGGLAAVGFAFKPHLMVVPLITEALLVIHSRRLSTLLRPETLAAAGTVTLYLAAVFFGAKPYWQQVAPAISRVYWAFSYPFLAVLVQQKWQVLTCLAPLVVAWRARWPAAPSVLAAAAIGFLLSGLLQTKGYSYHFYPARVMAILSLALVTTQRGPQRIVAAVFLAAVLIPNALQTQAHLTARTDRGALGRGIGDMVRFVEEHVPEGGSFLAFSTHPFPGFPTTLYAHRDWASASNSQIFLPAVVRMREAARSGDDAILAFAEHQAQTRALADLETRPALVLVDIAPLRHAIGRSRFDFLAFYREDPAFAAVWSEYAEIDRAPDGFRAFVHRAGNKP